MSKVKYYKPAHRETAMVYMQKPGSKAIYFTVMGKKWLKSCVTDITGEVKAGRFIEMTAEEVFLELL